MDPGTVGKKIVRKIGDAVHYPHDYKTPHRFEAGTGKITGIRELITGDEAYEVTPDAAKEPLTVLFISDRLKEPDKH